MDTLEQIKARLPVKNFGLTHVTAIAGNTYTLNDESFLADGLGAELTVWDHTAISPIDNPAQPEIVKIKTRPGSKQFTFDRAQQGTARRVIAVGDFVTWSITTKLLRDLIDNIAKGGGNIEIFVQYSADGNTWEDAQTGSDDSFFRMAAATEKPANDSNLWSVAIPIGGGGGGGGGEDAVARKSAADNKAAIAVNATKIEETTTELEDEITDRRSGDELIAQEINSQQSVNGGLVAVAATDHAGVFRVSRSFETNTREYQIGEHYYIAPHHSTESAMVRIGDGQPRGFSSVQAVPSGVATPAEVQGTFDVILFGLTNPPPGMDGIAIYALNPARNQLFQVHYEAWTPASDKRIFRVEINAEEYGKITADGPIAGTELNMMVAFRNGVNIVGRIPFDIGIGRAVPAKPTGGTTAGSVYFAPSTITSVEEAKKFVASVSAPVNTYAGATKMRMELGATTKDQPFNPAHFSNTQTFSFTKAEMKALVDNTPIGSNAAIKIRVLKADNTALETFSLEVPVVAANSGGGSGASADPKEIGGTIATSSSNFTDYPISEPLEPNSEYQFEFQRGTFIGTSAMGENFLGKVLLGKQTLNSSNYSTSSQNNITSFGIGRLDNNGAAAIQVGRKDANTLMVRVGNAEYRVKKLVKLGARGGVAGAPSGRRKRVQLQQVSGSAMANISNIVTSSQANYVNNSGLELDVGSLEAYTDLLVVFKQPNLGTSVFPGRYIETRFNCESIEAMANISILTKEINPGNRVQDQFETLVIVKGTAGGLRIYTSSTQLDDSDDEMIVYGIP